MNFKCGFCVFMMWVFGGSVWLWPLLYCRQPIVVFCVDVILVVGWCQLEFDLCACAMFGRQVNWGKLCVPPGFQERERNYIIVMFGGQKSLEFFFLEEEKSFFFFFHFLDFIKLNENFKTLMW